MFDINKEKIDIVYTWVDDKDLNWLRKKNEYINKSKISVDDSNSDCRYINNDELKYSLRSLEKYASWINKVFIVTDNQVPQWLNTSNPKVRIVDHKEIIPPECLPTFNSIAIEHCIHNIKELSEYFLYACDDMFIARPVSPDFFFAKDGYPYCRFGSKYKNEPDTEYSKIVVRTDDLIKNKYGFYLGMFLHHNIDAYNKSTVKECFQNFENEINNTVLCKFREPSNIERQIYSVYALARKKGHYKGIFRIDKYTPIYKNKLLNYLYSLQKKESVYIPAYQNNFDEILKNGDIKLFCINDGGNTTYENRKAVQEFLQNYYPEKSSFEL